MLRNIPVFGMVKEENEKRGNRDGYHCRIRESGQGIRAYAP